MRRRATADVGHGMARRSRPTGSRNQQPPLPQQLLQNEATARFDAAVGAEIGFVERLVWFWSNHFCISADKIVAMAGAYEREAIRPHVLGRFADMLQRGRKPSRPCCSISTMSNRWAPNSVAGINRDKGLNENLAREMLELHTLGVRSGYTQTDVTNFAKVLTGWTWMPPAEPEHGGEFVFVKRLHEPGEQTVLGKLYPDTGVEQGRAVLADLARHPATAQHIAQKLARHFVADEPPPALVAKLAKDIPGHRRRSQGGRQDAGHGRRILDAAADQAQAAGGMDRRHAAPDRRAGRRSRSAADAWARRRQLGEALWRPPAPNGYPDTEAAWIDGVPHRLDIANEFAGRVAGMPIRWRCSTAASVRSPRPTRARPSRAPKAAPRRWRCWS